MAHARLLIALLLISASIVTGCDSGTSATDRERVVIDGRTFDLEYAVDEARRQRGLAGRTDLPDDGGMLFVFPDVAVQSFWMYDCLIDIDVIFLDARGTVTAIHRMKAEPPRLPDETDREYETRLPRYTSVYPAQFAIELRSGTLDQLDISVDERIDLDLPRLKAMAATSDG